jgi:GT2 family glycosyltransferase
LFEQRDASRFSLNVFVVDGGSSDGTTDSIRSLYPSVHLSVHNGLYWAGGMYVAWKEALESGKEYDYFLLLNDDVEITNNCLADLLNADTQIKTKFGQSGIYVGATCDPITKEYTYGGTSLKTGKSVIPNGEFQKCDLANANIMLIPKEVYEKVGILSNEYIHNNADYDYSLRAIQAGFTVYILPRYLGTCTRDHGKPWLPMSTPLKERIKYMYSPTGLSYADNLIYIKKFFPQQYLRLKILLWMKTLFPFMWDLFK